MDVNWANLNFAFERLAKYEGNYWIVSRYITALPVLKDFIGLKVLLRGEITDFIEGASSLKVIQELVAGGAEVRTSSNINAKVYLREIQGKAVGCVGSPNLTNAAFSGNVEVIAGPVELSTDFIEELKRLWSEARPMTAEELSYLSNYARVAKPWRRNPEAFISPRDLEIRLKSTDNLIQDLFAKMAEGYNNPNNTFGLTTGFKELDLLTSGLARGTLTIIAGRPSMGKSSLALTIALNCLLRQNCPLLYFSLEMSAEQVMLRMHAMEARVDMSRIRLNQMSERDFQRLADTAARISEGTFSIDDTSDLSIEELSSQARLFAQKHKTFLIVVDYLQLMSSSFSNSNARHQEVSTISKGLKNLARELNIPIIALSQVSRFVETRPNKRPRLSDLSESGQLEADADLIMFIYRDEYYDAQSEKPGIAEIIVGKQRNGPVGTVEVQFHSAHVRFNDLARPQ
jgi:KaiC/GvpD/RAD55 family RecA-like ATPase